MTRYSPERKEAVLKKLLPPHPRSVAEVAKEEGIHEATLYNWKKALRESGAVVPDSNTPSDQWSAQTKLAVVAENLDVTTNWSPYRVTLEQESCIQRFQKK